MFSFRSDVANLFAQKQPLLATLCFFLRVRVIVVFVVRRGGPPSDVASTVPPPPQP